MKDRRDEKKGKELEKCGFERWHEERTAGSQAAKITGQLALY